MFFVNLLQFLFEAYIYILLVRLLLQKLGENWNNPISRFVVILTEPIVKPLRKYIPGFKGFDLAIFIPALLINIIEILLIFKIKVNIMPGIVGSIVIGIGYIGYKFVYIYIWGIILSAIMSWVPALQHNPIASVVNTIATPLMKLGQRFIPRVANIDLSPIVLLLALWLVKFIILHPILMYGLRLAY